MRQDEAKRIVREKFPNADWMRYSADGIYANGVKIASGKTPKEAWINAGWAVKLRHVK